MKIQNQMKGSKTREKEKYTVLDVNYLWKLFLGHKKWFALSVAFCLCCGVAYVYLSRPSYNILGKMQVISRRQTTGTTSAASSSLLNQLPSGLGSSLSLSRATTTENEKEILKTKQLAKDVVEDLGLYTEIRHQKLLKSRLLYKNQPIDVQVSPECLQTMSDNLPMRVYRISLTIDKSDEGFTVKGKLRKNKKKSAIPEQTFAKLPAVIHTEIGNLTLTDHPLLTEEDRKPFLKDYRLKIEINPPMTVAKKFVKKMNVDFASKKATQIIYINLQDESILRGIDFVNSLVAHYNEQDNAIRLEEATKNDEFVNERLAKIDRELSLTDADLEKLKKQYKILDPKVDAEEVIGKKSSYESQLVNFGIQEQLLDYLSDYVKDPANRFELIPVNVGVYSGDAVSMISRHNQLVNDRKYLLKSVTEQSTQVKQVTQLIDELHPIIQTAIKRDMESLQLRKNVAQREYNKYMGRVDSSPEQERFLTDVSRQRNIKQGVFMTLLQRRENIAMELANTIDKGRLIDETQSLKKTKPKTLIALLASIVLGLLLPYIFFFVRRSMKKNIDSEIDLKLLTRIPFTGSVPFSSQGADEDAFRLIRNNLLLQLRDGKKTILVTSANKGDGKTYCSTHLAEAFTRSGENTFVCNLLDIHPVGSADSANPADLLANSDLRQKLASLREKYDVIVIDGPEVDSYNEALIGTLADVTCFVCRPGKTSKIAIENFDKMKNDSRLNLPSIILNNGYR